MTTKQITVGYDGSAPSREAVMWAAAEASTRHAHLKIVRCFDIPVGSDAMFGFSPMEAIAAARTAVEQSLEKMQADCAADHPDLDVSTDVGDDSVLTRLVDGLGPDDLVVVGASGRRGAAAFWLGSTPRHLVGHGPCPVVVVRTCASRGSPDRVVVAVGAPEESARALSWAGDEADRHRVPLLVVHAWWYPYSDGSIASSQARDLTRIDAACVVDRAIERISQRCACECTGELVAARPTDAILTVVRDGDLLVLGSRGRGALRAGVVGSTVNSVLEAVAVPVVVVRDCVT